MLRNCHEEKSQFRHEKRCAGPWSSGYGRDVKIGIRAPLFKDLNETFATGHVNPAGNRIERQVVRILGAPEAGNGAAGLCIQHYQPCRLPCSHKEPAVGFIKGHREI